VKEVKEAIAALHHGAKAFERDDLYVIFRARTHAGRWEVEIERYQHRWIAEATLMLLYPPTKHRPNGVTRQGWHGAYSSNALDKAVQALLAKLPEVSPTKYSRDQHFESVDVDGLTFPAWGEDEVEDLELYRREGQR